MKWLKKMWLDCLISEKWIKKSWCDNKSFIAIGCRKMLLSDESMHVKSTLPTTEKEKPLARCVIKVKKQKQQTTIIQYVYWMLLVSVKVNSKMMCYVASGQPN